MKCEYCGNETPPSKGNRKRKYCSKKCAYNKYQSEGRYSKKKNPNWGQKSKIEKERIEKNRKELEWYRENWLTTQQVAQMINKNPVTIFNMAKELKYSPEIVRGNLAFWHPEIIEPLRNYKESPPNGYIVSSQAAEIFNVTTAAFFTYKIEPDLKWKGRGWTNTIFLYSEERIKKLFVEKQEETKLKEKLKKQKLEQEAKDRAIKQQQREANRLQRAKEKEAEQNRIKLKKEKKKVENNKICIARINKTKNRKKTYNQENKWVTESPKILENTVKIHLWKNKHELSEYYSIIDAEDYDKVMDDVTTVLESGKKRVNKWYVSEVVTGKKYAFDGSKRKSIHRAVMGYPKNMFVDHINGNPLDNRKENLRVCTPSENIQNCKPRRNSRSGYKGVWLSKDGLKIKAYIAVPGTSGKETIRLGSFKTLEEAARAYDAKARELFGEFARLNFPDE